MSFIKFIPLERKDREETQNGDVELLREYLKNQSPVKYSDHALQETASDVMAMDGDLREYVMHFLKSNEADTDISCECVSIEELLQTQAFTPVTAALFIQWYRKDPASAAGYLLHHDGVEGIPEELPQCEE